MQEIVAAAPENLAIRGADDLLGIAHDGPKPRRRRQPASLAATPTGRFIPTPYFHVGSPRSRRRFEDLLGQPVEIRPLERPTEAEHYQPGTLDYRCRKPKSTRAVTGGPVGAHLPIQIARSA
ncbi:hypothetical protein [Roseivivax sp. CAU 1753]